MKGIFYLNFALPSQTGVIKKIDYQVKSLKKLGFFVKKVNIKEEKFYINEFFLNNYTEKMDKISKIKRKLELYRILKKLANEKLYKDITYIYIRYEKTNPLIIRYYKYLKKIGKKIIIEIPTYPYDGEIKKESIFTKMDKKYRLELYKYVDKIVTYSKDKEIWKIPCINISNGIDLEEIKMMNKTYKNDKKLVFTSISTCSFWHGIDRLLKSLLEYKKNGGEKEIIFNIVGEGTETSKLKRIVEDNPILKESVIFHGFKSGMGLDEIYNNTDIAVGSLGIHRIEGLKEVQPLKNREYCAKGLPFIISFKDPDFVNKKFVYNNINNNDDLFDISKIVEWYENLNITSEEIRKYSKQFSWDIQMKKVIDNIGD